MEELKQKLSEAYDLLKDFSQFKHLFSEDDAMNTLAKLRRTIGQIQFKVKASKMKDLCHPKNKALQENKRSGALVKIRPCGDEYKDKTYIGFYIGDMACGSSIELTDDNKIQLNFGSHNPAIFIPELKKIIYGYESWWGEVESIDDLKDITDDDIDNVWYVKLLKQQITAKEKQ